jgi:single-stranded-DNA-specific exonuclease
MPSHELSQPVWVFPSEDPNWTQKIIKEFKVHPVIAKILVSRGFASLDEIHRFLYAKLPTLFDPKLFADMDKAVDRVITAINKKENILIYGDNDVDGMTSTALLVDFLKKINASVFFFVPSRNSLQKSFIKNALEYAISKNCSLIITVDCGITAADEIDEIVQNKIDVIITDHHEPTSRIPNCIATLNPKLINSTYPNRDLTGVGVAFKLAHAITNYLIEEGSIAENKIDLKDYLDLVALGTISDMGSLLGENRILVRYGLKQLRNTKRIGLSKLCNVSELETIDLTPMDIASKVAPRLNSLGRIADPHKGVELLLIKNESQAEILARELDLYNIERQKIERLASADIERYILKHPGILNEKAIVLHSKNWHPGIIPIIAARIAKYYNRPTLIISIENGIGKGSVRTIPEFPLLNTLKKYSKYLINFGGHDYAAGLTINEENIEKFKRFFITDSNEYLKDQDVVTKLYLDAKVDFSDLTFDFMESFSLFEPFGNENPPPLLYTNVNQTWVPKVVGKIHLKMFLEQNERTLEGIAFGMATRRNELRKKKIAMKIAFSPHINMFLNKASIQLQIKDFKF